MIHVRNLRVDYDEVCAVRDLCLEVGPGEIYGLIGPNGAGKTSTLRALVGLVEATYGDVIIGGFDLDHQREQAVGLVGFMPDSAPIYEDLTVWEFLDLFAAAYGLPPHRRGPVIDQHLQLVDLTEKRHALTSQLSRGMRQRLMLAKTLLPDPRVLLLDEPASGVDPNGRALLKQILRDLGQAGKTVIISSHILSELSEFCTSVGVMQKGEMVVSGTVADVAARVMGRARVALEVVGDPASAATVLAADPRVSAPVWENGACRFAFEGEGAEASELLTALVTAGVRVSSFSREKEDLEALFLKIGAKEVS
ncbi:ABC transporter ATP-binding protein [bacterium]|nr:ABC transporter ATP-binding protein [bacterium]